MLRACIRLERSAIMVGRPPWALGFAALCVALAAAACSGPPAPGAVSAGDSAVAAQTLPGPGRPDSGAEDDPAGQATYGAQSAGAPVDPGVSSMGPPVPSTQRDQRTLNQDHPYRDRHGLAACEMDCSVHEAGYKWAALHSLRDSRLCAGLTVAFVDGCRAYVVDHQG
jgi:hypothetical protein